MGVQTSVERCTLPVSSLSEQCAVHFLAQLVSLFPDQTFDNAATEQTACNLQQFSFQPLFAFHAYAARLADTQAVSGPDVSALRSRVAASRALDVQLKAHGCATALAPLISGALTKDQHMAEALRCQHPYQAETVLETDVRFVLDLFIDSSFDVSSW
eukprot:6479744-Amphidinium_carterae.1